MTDNMLAKARENAGKLGFDNVEFIFGDIEDMPLPDNTAHVVISNCVLNLVPDKAKAFSQIYRILKAGGHFCISDVVLHGELPAKLQKDAEMYAGCVAGAIQKDLYLALIVETGFVQIDIHKNKEVKIPEDILLNYLSRAELDEYASSGKGIFSITVSAVKPG
jgi:SAM-dependent methyltransferase